MRPLPRHSWQLSSARADRMNAALETRPSAAVMSPREERKDDAAPPSRPYDSTASGTNGHLAPRRPMWTPA
jgi:hypothetical protein